ncbi:SurA N-terminal domain-containing protein [Thauera sp. Sel9]|uniref:SurA N-terminal domain-containing protein n=1 Tax=Thauera sp. Sel9 TaxID=2974299 RepID=UPI0021E1A937|nr:SurA N-terminal domain-containing protein [Thauera sp. Sel9]MCV2217956.1 SurA N-terminal domain-containing protein [Thauera sp. Sel9]
MFEAVRNNKRIAQIILAVLIVPFAFFGMDAYFSDAPGGNEVAVVAGTPIGALEFEQALRDQQDRLRAAAGGEVDRALLESEALRRSVLDNVINRRVLALYAADNRFSVTPQELQETIAAVPSFQEDGRFSLERYEMLLRAQGMTPAMFESRLAQDVRIQHVSLAVGDAGFAPLSSARRFLEAQLEERTVSELRLSGAGLAADLQVGDDEIGTWYAANAARFQRPARLQAEYVVFDREAVEKQVSVGEDEIKAFYDGNPGRFGVAEERQARHILLELAADADAAEVERVMGEARAIAEQLRKDPSAFAEVAKEKSKDSGSASRGGDLGFFGRGAMVASFEDAAFSQQKDEIGEPVRSDFGVHVIQVTAIKPASTRPFDEVRGEIETELRSQAASRLFAEQAEQFANMVYEQSDSLAPVAEALKLEVRSTDWVSRNGGNVGGYSSERLLDTLFADDAVTSARNTEAIEVAPNTLVAARVKAFEAAVQPPLDEVRDEVVAELRREAGAKRAQEQGSAMLAALDKGEAVEGNFGAVRKLQRAAPGLPGEAMQAVFSAPTAKLPAHVGLALPDGDYVIYRIEAVDRPQITDGDERVRAVAEQYGQVLAERDFAAFIAELRKRYEVQVKLTSQQAQQ